MPTLSHSNLAAAPKLLRTIAQHNLARAMLGDNTFVLGRLGHW
jgi:hypothetical protein